MPGMRWDQRISIAELNIENFRLRLAGDLDEVQRRTIVDLLGKEETKLRHLRGGRAGSV